MERMAGFTIDPHGACFFGAGTVAQLPELVSRLSHDRVFLVTDAGVAWVGVAAAVERILAQAGIEVGVFDDIRPNPDTDTLDAGGRAIRAFGNGAVVAVGGGAVMDVAKGLALMAVNQGVARDFDYTREPRRHGLPVIAVPTTAGTGSETNGWGVIDDDQACRKFYVGHWSVAPRFVILDPELTIGLPRGATASSGMDALCHALESLSSVRSNPYADALNTQVVQLVSRHLPRAVADGTDLEARSELLLAAYLAGLAFATTGLGMAHAVGHALSARAGTPHGVALSLILPHVMEFNLPVRQSVYARLTEALGVDQAGSDVHTRAQASIDAVRRLGSEIGLPCRLGEIGCTEGHIPVIVEDALSDLAMLNTPRTPTVDELTEVLRAAM